MPYSQKTKTLNRSNTATNSTKAVINGPQSFKKTLIYIYGFSSGSDGEEFSCNAGDPGLIPGSERSPGEGNGNPLQYSCLENSTDRETWWDTVHGGHKESDMTERLPLSHNQLPSKCF